MEIIFFVVFIYLFLIWLSDDEESISEKKKVDLRLTIKAIIRWEQLNKKPFSQLNYSNENEVISLFYVCTTSGSNIIQKSLDEFKESLTEEEIKKMIADFERQTFLSSQFQNTPEKKNSDSGNLEPMYIKDIVPMLVMSGLDVHFAMNEMELCDLQILLQAYDQKAKESLAIQRLWTFIQVSPHLNKKIKTPKDLHPFIWEITPTEISEEELEKGKDEFKTFLQTGLKK